MFASTFLSRLTSSAPQPLLPISSTPSIPPLFTDLPHASPTDTTATLLALARQEAHLQSHIQYLLDVQSDRLLEGLGGDSAAATPTPRSSNGVHDHDRDYDSQNRRREAGKKKPTLQGARKQIRTAISDLHALKLQTADLVTADLSTTTEELNHITSIQSKKAKLEHTIQELEASPASKELEALARDDEDLGRKIYEVENQLFEMKARQRVVRQRLEEGRNREEARVSSFKGSLEILEREERGVLERKSPLIGKGWRGGKGKKKRGSGEGDEGMGESVWDLPPKRRTLSMVGEYYESEKEALIGSLKGVETEVGALEEGGQVWDEVVREVGNVERMLENEMKGLDHLNGDGGKNHEEKRVDGMRRVLDAMVQTRGKVGKKLKMAEEKGWNLLVVCVGAELEALVEGEEILKGVLEVEDEEGAPAVDGGGVRNGTSREGTAEGKGLEDVRELDMHERKETVDDTDDEPGPELLLSTHYN
ncbi:MAG: hypothetical protein Q9209_006138 [Squamulea sp. 1 TL-2023]